MNRKKAALYYENLLLYDAEYPVAYGEYGMFLIRTGQKEASRKLWEDYKEKKKRNYWMTVKAEICSIWEEINEKRRESDQEKPKEMKITSRKTCFIVCFCWFMQLDDPFHCCLWI